MRWYRNKAGREQKHTALGAHTLQKKGLQRLLNVLSRLKSSVSKQGSLLGNSTDTKDVAHCTRLGMMGLC